MQREMEYCWSNGRPFTYVTEMVDMDEITYYQCDHCGRTKMPEENAHGRVPVCSRCGTPMTLRVIEQLDLGLEFPDDVEPTKPTQQQHRFRVIYGGKA